MLLRQSIAPFRRWIGGSIIFWRSASLNIQWSTVTYEIYWAEGQTKLVSRGHLHYICQIHWKGAKKLLLDIVQISYSAPKIICCSVRAWIGEDEILFVKRMENAQRLTSLEQHGSLWSECSWKGFSKRVLYVLYAILQSAYVHHNWEIVAGTIP